MPQTHPHSGKLTYSSETEQGAFSPWGGAGGAGKAAAMLPTEQKILD